MSATTTNDNDTREPVASTLRPGITATTAVAAAAAGAAGVAAGVAATAGLAPVLGLISFNHNETLVRGPSS